MAAKKGLLTFISIALSWASMMAFAQTPPAAGEGAKAVAGTWELSNAERDRSCTLILRGNTKGSGFALEWQRPCAELFPFTRDVVAWRIGSREALQLLDAKEQPVLELTEVEGGLYEGERPGFGLLFLQNVVGDAGTERKAEQLVGDWAFMLGAGKPLCQITLSATAAAQDAFALRVKPGCDALITRFGPIAWRLDRGQLVLIRARGDPWRFEENDSVTWRRIPEGRQPLQLVRQ